MVRGDVLDVAEGSLIERVGYWLERSGILQNRYFGALADDRITRENFVSSQRQFFFAVRYFSRPMAALLARMPDSGSRQGLIHNLSEEHGFEDDEGPARFEPAVAHDLTFLAFLKTLGIDARQMAGEREGAAVRAFNVGLMGCCQMEPIGTAFACLGVIEYAFADICELIGGKVVERGWIAADDLVHYKLHAQIDKRHAADFFNVVADRWHDGGRKEIEDGMILGLYLFNRLYEDLGENRHVC